MEFSGLRSHSRYNRRRQLPINQLTQWLTVACILLLAEQTICQQKSEQDAIQTVLIGQVAAWNRGDVDGYMQGYWQSDSTVFTSGGTLTKGYREVLLRYKKNYDSPKKMGRLDFRDLVIQQLSPSTAVAMGIWQLTRRTDAPWGRFTLILEKKPEGWRITHDHTSSAGN